jgi:hypothetical protein
MKTRKRTQANSPPKISDATLAQRYLDLQKLRDKVRKAESGCGISHLFTVPHAPQFPLLGRQFQHR